jgi:hypothetical protein
VIARVIVKWIIICLFIIFLTFIVLGIIRSFLQELEYSNFHITIKNKTDSDIQIYIENKNNTRIINVKKKGFGDDIFFLDKRKWKSNNIWTFKFTMTANNSMFFQKIITFPGNEIGVFSSYGGFETFIVIEDSETEFNVTFKHFIPEEYYSW